MADIPHTVPQTPSSRDTAQVPQVQSLTRGLAVIRAFDGEHPRQTLAQVAERTQLARATARRFLYTLTSEGYAATDGTEFWLTPKILELGYAYLSSLGLPTIAQPHIEQLSHATGESCSLSVLDGSDVVYVARTAVRRIMATNITIGTRFPAYATSMGRVLLADLSDAKLGDYLSTTPLEAITPRTISDESELRSVLDKVRRDGWCIVNQELELGLRSIAGPVRNRAGHVVAAVNVSTQVAMHDEDELNNVFLPELLRTCEAISRDLMNVEAH